MSLYYERYEGTAEDITQNELNEIPRAVNDTATKLAVDGVAEDVIGTFYYLPNSDEIIDGNGHKSQVGGIANLS